MKMKEQIGPSSRNHLVLVAALTLAVAMLPSCGDKDEVSGDKDDTASIAQVKSVGDAFVKAVNSGDVEGAAACWADDAEFVNQTTGLQITGKQEILAALKRVCAEKGKIDPDESLTVVLVTPDVAIEHGRSWCNDESAQAIKFVTLYVRRDDQWKISRMWQSRVEVSSHYAQLRPLASMIGEWSEERDGKTVQNVCRWSRNRNFIIRTFVVSSDGKELVKGAEVIGWNPATEQVQSWTFDSTGGFATGRWLQDDSGWKPEITDDVAPGDSAERKEMLASLAWMVGDWVDDDEEIDDMEASCKWSDGGAFLTQRWKVLFAGKTPLEGLTIIGWDPREQTIRSWTFDTDGGFAEFLWSWKDDAWYANGAHVLPDGRRASSITIYKKVDDKTYTWQRVSQELAGELLSDGSKRTIVRK